MSFRVAYNFAACWVILTLNMIFPVKGQCTIQGCENGESLNSIGAELNVEAIRQLNQQVQSLRELITESFQQIRNQHDTVFIRLEAVDRHSQEQVQGMENQNVSLQQIKNQQDTVMTSLQAVDRRSQEQEIHIKQVQSIHDLLNESFQEMKNQNNTVMISLQAIDRRSKEQVQSIHELLNTSFQQMKDQHAAAMRRLDVVIQLLLYHNISIENQTQNTRNLAIGLPVQLEVDFGDGPVLLPIVNNWIIIMHRFDGSLSFKRNWTEYRNGFGDKGRGEFWLGNEIVHRLTNRSAYTLRIEVQLNATGEWYYADYATFSLDSESNKYVLRLSGFSGNATDSLISTSMEAMSSDRNLSFSTWDSDNDICQTGSCAQDWQGGWWFSCCSFACLTCYYNNEFFWYSLRHLSSGGRLRAARMMIKSK